MIAPYIRLPYVTASECDALLSGLAREAAAPARAGRGGQIAANEHGHACALLAERIREAKDASFVPSSPRDAGKVPTAARYEASTRTIRSVPENYWLASCDSWDGAVNHEAAAAIMARSFAVEAAARAIIYQRDYRADHGAYDRTKPNPDAEPDQCFDDWASDILGTVLAAKV